MQAVRPAFFLTYMAPCFLGFQAKVDVICLVNFGVAVRCTHACSLGKTSEPERLEVPLQNMQLRNGSSNSSIILHAFSQRVSGRQPPQQGLVDASLQPKAYPWASQKRNLLVREQS